MKKGTRYSEEFKEAVVKRLLLNEITLSEAHRQYKVSLSTLRKWRDHGKTNNISTSTTSKGEEMKTLSLPDGVSYLDAHDAVVVKRVVSDVEFGKYCRSRGLTTQQVQEWETWFAGHPRAIDEERYEQAQKDLRQAQQKQQKLERQIERKDKALAQTAEMLLLSKKARAILEEEDN